MTRPTEPLHILAVADNVPRGIDWYRLVTPLYALGHNGYPSMLVPTRLLSQEHYDWADVIIFSSVYPDTPESLAALRAYCTRTGKVLVKDIDDDHWNPDAANVYYQEQGDIPGTDIPYPWTPLNKALPMIDEVVQQADLITVTNNTLRDRIKERFGIEAAVLPNCINPADWLFDRTAARTIPGLTVGITGGRSHVEDWRVLADVFPVIAERYPEVTFFVVGFLPDYLESLPCADRIVFNQGAPWMEYPPILTNIDIGLAPLLDTSFNRVKSPAKLFEYSMAGAATVASRPVYETVEPAVTAFAFKFDGWALAIAELLDDEPRRRQCADRARRIVLRDHNILTRWHLWATAYTEAVKRARRPKLFIPGARGR